MAKYLVLLTLMDEHINGGDGVTSGNFAVEEATEPALIAVRSARRKLPLPGAAGYGSAGHRLFSAKVLLVIISIILRIQLSLSTF